MVFHHEADWFTIADQRPPPSPIQALSLLGAEAARDRRPGPVRSRRFPAPNRWFAVFPFQDSPAWSIVFRYAPGWRNGRRVGLKNRYRKVCGFESHSGYHKLASSPPGSFSFSASHPNSAYPAATPGAFRPRVSSGLLSLARRTRGFASLRLLEDLAPPPLRNEKVQIVS